MDRSKFLKKLKQKFPNLTNALNGEMGQFHFEMEVFYRFTQDQLNNNNEEVLLECFQLANEFYDKGDKKLKNAIDVSFVENLNFQQKKWAWELLPQKLQQLYIEFHLKKGA